MILRSVLMSIALMFGAAGASAETIDTPACRQDLAATWSKMEEMLVRLKSAVRAAQNEKCDTYRHHVEVVVKAREVFARCKTGRDRVGDIAQMDGALEDVTSVIDRECNNGLGPIQPHVRAPDYSRGDLLAR